MGSSRPKAARRSPRRRRARRSVAARPFSSRSWSFPHLKRRAADNAHDKAREAIILGFSIANNLANSRGVVVFNAAAEREGEQFFGHRPHKQLRPVEQGLLQAS